MSTHDPNLPCEMFCEGPIGPDGDPGGDAWKACCPTCTEALTFICREVMPAIRRDGYYAPPGASVEQEFAAMEGQNDFRPAASALLTDLLGEGGAAALGWASPRGGETA